MTVKTVNMSAVDYEVFMQWCRDVRAGSIEATREQRGLAKAMTHHEMYGTGPQKLASLMDKKHDWVRSRLGHGESMCSRCMITNREAAVLGRLEKCDG